MAALSLFAMALAGAAVLAPAEAAEITSLVANSADLAFVLAVIHFVLFAFLHAVDPYGSDYYPPYLGVYPHNVEAARRLMRWAVWSAAAWVIPALLDRPGARVGALAHAILISAVYMASHWGLRRHNVFHHWQAWDWNWTGPRPVSRKGWAKGIARICEALIGADAGHALAAYPELRRELFEDLQARHAFALYGPELDDTVRERLTAFLEAWPERAPASLADPAWLALQAAAQRYYRALPNKPPATASPSWPRRLRRRKPRPGVA